MVSSVVNTSNAVNCGSIAPGAARVAATPGEGSFDEDFTGGESGAFDGAFLGRRIDRFEKVAVVGEPDWLLPLKTASRQMKGELRVFEADQAQEAWRWLEQ